MTTSRKKARAQLAHREWVEFQIDMESDGRIVDVQWRAWGCHDLLTTASRAAEKMKGQNLDKLFWSGVEHGDLLIREALDRLRGNFKLPIDDPETCHCRKIPTATVDEAIVLGAHTPEKVTNWTLASTGCGTCRPDVEKLIAYRLKKVA
jgi:bacterioferritin-associated ferredoxin